MTIRVLLFKDLASRGITYARVHLNRLIREGSFPPPIQLSPSRVAWREADIDRWITSRPLGQVRPPARRQNEQAQQPEHQPQAAPRPVPRRKLVEPPPASRAPALRRLLLEPTAPLEPLRCRVGIPGRRNAS
jgi:predicted DNA-binding transcriptional regulator AlpA